MRAVALVLVLLLSGCAQAPEPTSDPSPTTPTTPATPSPTTSPTPPPVDSPAYVETNGSWTMRVTPGAIRITYGTPWSFVADFASNMSVEPDVSFSPWVEVTRAEGGHVEGWVYPGAPGGLAATLSAAGSHVGFRGPPVEGTNVVESAAFETLTSVSDDAPGLSAKVEGDRVTVTYAARANATTTADERIAQVDGLKLVDDNGIFRILAFVSKSSSDAVMHLPAPERTRIVGTIEHVPAGDIQVRAIVKLACFCFPPPKPTTEEIVVRVEG